MGALKPLTDEELADLAWPAIRDRVEQGDKELKLKIADLCFDLTQLRSFMENVISDLGKKMMAATFPDPPPTVQQVRAELLDVHVGDFAVEQPYPQQLHAEEPVEEYLLRECAPMVERQKTISEIHADLLNLPAEQLGPGDAALRLDREEGWKKVVFAHDLRTCDDGCGDPYCDECDKHYADCACIGPTDDDCEYLEVDGVLYGRKQ